MSYCEEKHRLIRAHADEVNRYVQLVERRHHGADGLTDDERSALTGEIKTARIGIDDLRIALDVHASEHGCSTAATESASIRR